MEIEQRIYNADQARQVLENEAFTAAFADIKQELTESWENTPTRDQAGREQIWLMLKLLNKVQLTLQLSLESGKLAKADLAYKESLAQRLKNKVSGLL